MSTASTIKAIRRAAVPPRAGGTHPKAKGSKKPKKKTESSGELVPRKRTRPDRGTARSGPTINLGSDSGAPYSKPINMGRPPGTAVVPAQSRQIATKTQDFIEGESRRVPNSRAFTKAHAAGVGVGVAAIAVGSSNRGDGSMASQSTSTTVSKPPSGKANLTEVRAIARRRSTTSTPTGGTPKKAPQARSGASRGGSSASPIRGPDKGQSMADFLGLSKDSAVRHYMDTGQHKYPVKGATSAVKSGKGRTKAK